MFTVQIWELVLVLCPHPEQLAIVDVPQVTTIFVGLLKHITRREWASLGEDTATCYSRYALMFPVSRWTILLCAFPYKLDPQLHTERLSIQHGNIIFSWRKILSFVTKMSQSPVQSSPVQWLLMALLLYLVWLSDRPEGLTRWFIA